MLALFEESAVEMMIVLAYAHILSVIQLQHLNLK